MRISLGLPLFDVEHGDEFLSAAAIAEVASAAERVGFDACYVTDHPFPLARWVREGGHHALDPFVALSFAAAATTRLRLHTHILVLPYRNPFLVARAAASLDVLSGGRMILGVAAGYLRSEFAALGADFENRAAITDESIDAIRRAWSGEEIHLEGRYFRAVGNVLAPRPLQRPHPPIWVGGNSQQAIRRAVERGDGWSPFPNPSASAAHTRTAAIESHAELAERIAYAREHADRIGRTEPLDVCYALGSRAAGAFDVNAVRDSVRALAALGVTWATVRLTAPSRDELVAEVARLGGEILPVAHAAPETR